MARNQSALVNWSQYFGLRAIAAFMQCFSAQQNLDTVAAIGSCFYRANRHRRDRAERNIAMSFPGWPQERVIRTAEQSMQHMFQLFMVDALVTPRLITPHSWPSYISLHKVRPILDRLIRGEPMILLTGHCGNWELLGHFFALLGYPLIALARPIDNPLINRWVMGLREARGTRIITKWGATPILQESLQRSGRLGFIADQNAGDGGMFVPFFGRLASSYKSIGLLAMRYNVPVIAGTARRIRGKLQYEIACTDVITPDDWSDQPDPLFYITARYNRAMEQMIREAPEQYLWLHRRWKSRPKHEREGAEFPRKLREKIEALPWMTQEELQRIVTYRHEV